MPPGASFDVDYCALAHAPFLAAVLGKGGHGPNLTQPNPAASMLGFTAPRMSNAFARRHGLNPRDNPMINLQKIALQSQQQAAVALAAQQQQQVQVQQQQQAQVQQVSGRRVSRARFL